MCKAILTIFFLIFANSLIHAQTTRAIIVGVSKYPNIPKADLKYAAIDAQSVYNFLIKEHIVNPENAVLLLDEQTQKDKKILSLIYEAITNSNKDDMVILYFACHGDMSVVVSADPFFLLNEAEHGDYFSTNAIPMETINKYIATADKKGVKVLLIVDACHAGVMINSNETKAESNKRLSNSTFGNTIKILACGPEETSKEDAKWGHGVFTYFLLQGFEGKADHNKDYLLKSNEIARFLKLRVPAEVHDQHPIVSGDTSFVLFKLQNKTDTKIPFTNQNEHQKYTLKDLLYNESKQRGENKNKNEYSTTELTKYLVALFETAMDDNLLITHKYMPNIDLGKIKYSETALFWNLEEQRSTKNSMAFTALAVSPTAKYMVVGGGSNKILAFEIVQDKINLLLTQKLAKSASSFAFSANEKVLAAANGNELQFFSVPDFELFSQYVGSKSIKNIIFIESKELVVFTDGNNLCFLDVNTMQVLQKMSFATSINKLKWIEHLQLMAIAHGNDVSIIENTDSWKVKWHKTPTDSEIHGLAFDVKNDVLFVGGKSKVILGLDAKNDFQRKMTIKIHNKNELANVSALAVIEGNYLIRAGKDWVLEVFDITTGKFIKEVKVQSGITDMVFNPIDQQVYFCDFRENVGKLKFVIPKKTALEYITDLEKSSIGYNKTNYYKRQLALALRDNSDTLIQHFIDGKPIDPSIELVKEGIYELEVAEKLMAHDPIHQKFVTVDKLCLMGYEILMTNDVANYEKAVDYFEQIRILLPTSTYPINALSLIRKRKNELEIAKELLAKATSNVPKWIEPKALTGKVLLKEGKYAQSLAEFQKIITLQPENVKGYHLKASVYLKLGMLPKAEELLNKGLKYDAKNPLILLDLAYLEAERGMFYNAANFIELAKKISPELYMVTLATAEIKLKQYDEHGKTKTNEISIIGEIKFIYDALIKNTAAQIKPEVWNSYAEFLKYQCHHKLYHSKAKDDTVNKEVYNPEILAEIKKSYTQALSLDPYSCQAMAGLAWVESVQPIHAGHTVKYREQKALKWLNDAITLNEKFPEGYYYLADYYQKNDDTTNALKMYHKSLETDPNFTPSILKIIELEKNVHEKKKFYTSLQNDSLIHGRPALSFAIAYDYFKVDNKIESLKYLNCTMTNDSKYGYSFNAIKQLENNVPLTDKSIKNIQVEFGNEILRSNDGYVYYEKRAKNNDKSLYYKVNVFNSEAYWHTIDSVFTKNDFAFVKTRKSVDKSTSLSPRFDIYINKSIKLNYPEIQNYSFITNEILAIQNDKNEVYILNPDGKLFMEGKFQEASYLPDTKLILLKKGDKLSCVNAKAKVIIPAKYWTIKPFTYFEKRGNKRIAKYLLKCVDAETLESKTLDENGNQYKE